MEGAAAIEPVLVAVAAAFAAGGALILGASLVPRLRLAARGLWRIYASEFLIVGALIGAAALEGWFFAAVLAAFCWRGVIEIFGLFDFGGQGAAKALCTVICIGIVAAGVLGGPLPMALAAAAGILVVLAGARLFGRRGERPRLAAAAGTALVVGVLAATIGVLRSRDDGFGLLVFVYGTVEIADSFALLIGKLFGRRPAFPRLSPRKTVEGLIGGLAVGSLAGLILARYLLRLAPAEAFPLVAIIVAAGTLGDLLTSALKRARGKKDFPSVLAGHGGVLDIYDSFLFAAPAAALWQSRQAINIYDPLVIAAAAAFVAAAVIAVACYNLITGRNLVSDVWLEYRLMRADLAALDSFCRDNPCRSDVVVSMTSLPSRLPMIFDTIKSLLRQSRAPAEIRVYLPRLSKREQTAYQVPQALRALASVGIYECPDDYGPATKFLPAVSSLPPDAKLLVVDDDRIYQRDMLETLDDAATASPDAAFGLGGWIVPADLVDRDTTILRNIRNVPPAQVRPTRIRRATEVDVLMGAHAYLVRPRFFDLARLNDYSGAPKEVFFADDIWISAHCRVPKYALPARYADFQPHRHVPAYDRSSLGWINRTGDPERWVNSVVLKYFGHAPWRVGGGRNENGAAAQDLPAAASG